MDAPDSDGWTPLMLASWSGQLAIVEVGCWLQISLNRIHGFFRSNVFVV